MLHSHFSLYHVHMIQCSLLDHLQCIVGEVQAPQALSGSEYTSPEHLQVVAVDVPSEAKVREMDVRMAAGEHVPTTTEQAPLCRCH